jgi:hypothetical protein
LAVKRRSLSVNNDDGRMMRRVRGLAHRHLSRPNWWTWGSVQAGPTRADFDEKRGDPNGSPRAIMHFHFVSPKNSMRSGSHRGR